jgi:hypothetical protein
LKFVNMKEATMFGKKQVTSVCDSACRAAKLRDDALFNAARLGPRI